MNGDPTVMPPTPPGNGQQEPARPLCAVNLHTSMTTNNLTEAERSLATANEKSRAATLEMCQDCLGRKAVEIICPLPGPQHPEANRFDLTLTKLGKITELLGITAGRRFNSLLLKTSSTPNPAIDTEIRAVLHGEGVPQVGNLRLDKEAPTSPVEGLILEGNVVPDPRPPEARTNRYTEDRPLCAKQLTEAFRQRRETIDLWEAKFLPRPKEEWEPIDHSADEKTYQAAIEATPSATKEDCARCLLHENCPLLAGVEFKRLFDTTSTKTKLPNGGSFRVAEITIEITSGRPRSTIDPVKLELTDKKHAKRAAEARAA